MLTFAMFREPSTYCAPDSNQIYSIWEILYGIRWHKENFPFGFLCLELCR